MASRRQRIIQAVASRLSNILPINGYNTNAGLNVFLGEDPTLGPDDPDVALSVSVGDTSNGQGLSQVLVEMPIEIVALAKADVDAPLLAIEEVIADIRRAIETADGSLGGECKQILRGSIRSLPRESGTSVVGAAVEYQVWYADVWGSPSA